jgi:hypothetical protein
MSKFIIMLRNNTRETGVHTSLGSLRWTIQQEAGLMCWIILDFYVSSFQVMFHSAAILNTECFRQNLKK